MELISVWMSEQNTVLPAWISSAGVCLILDDVYLSTFQQQFQPKAS
jgi:hypothetical protein